MVTHQTGPEGLLCERVYVELAEPFIKEVYLGIVLDRKAERIRVIASTEGGMEIEELAETSPEKIMQVTVCKILKIQSNLMPLLKIQQIQVCMPL